MNLLADTMVSPTSYMRAYFKQRGWQLPKDSVVIPNVMPAFKERTAVQSPLEDVRCALRLPRNLHCQQQPRY